MRLAPYALAAVVISLSPLAAVAQPAEGSPTAVLDAYFETTRDADHISEIIPFLPGELVELIDANMDELAEDLAEWLEELKTRVPSDHTFLEEVITGTEAIVSFNYTANGQPMGGLWILLLEEDGWKVLAE